jgi:hypothetical protein
VGPSLISCTDSRNATVSGITATIRHRIGAGAFSSAALGSTFWQNRLVDRQKGRWPVLLQDSFRVLLALTIAAPVPLRRMPRTATLEGRTVVRKAAGKNSAGWAC